MLYGCTIYTVPHQRFQNSSLCISPLGFLSSGRSKLPRHKRFLTLVSRFRPFACWSPSQPSYAFHIMDRRSLGRTTHAVPDIGSSVRPFAFRPRSSLSYDFLGVPPTSLLAVINLIAFRLHVTRGSRHRFKPRPFAFRQLDHHPAPSFKQALSRLAQAPPAPGCLAFLPRP
jgi:hypothetical protein